MLSRSFRVSAAEAVQRSLEYGLRNQLGVWAHPGALAAAQGGRLPERHVHHPAR